MIQVTNLSGAADQVTNVILANKSSLQMELVFRPAIARWSLNVKYGDFEANGINICVHPNLLRAWRKVMPFGLAVVAVDGVDPFDINDWQNINGAGARCTLFVLDSTGGNQDVQEVEAEVFA